MSRTYFKGPKLPSGLLGEIESGQQKLGNTSSRKSRYQDSRKDRRKAQRDDKKQRNAAPQYQARVTFNSHQEANIPTHGPNKSAHKTPQSDSRKSQRHNVEQSKRKSKPTVKARATEASSSDDETEPVVSRAVQERLAEDDVEIAALEKRLGVKGKKIKTSKAFEEDGLDFLLEDISDSDNAGKRKREEYDNYLQAKRRRTARTSVHDQSPGFSEDSDEESNDLGLDTDDRTDEDVDNGSDETGSETECFDGFEDTALSDGRFIVPRKENPYKAPVSNNSASIAKYVPPSMRQALDSDSEAKSRLRKQVQGLLNRLSEANVTTVVHDIERLYQNNPRQYVTTALIDLLIASLALQTRLNDTFVVLHAGFVAALYKVVGLEFGAQFVERIVLEFDKAYESRVESPDSKIAANLISLVAALYIFQVTTATVVFDYVRLFLQSVSEYNTELLLLIVRGCGIQLRQDDPSSLKDIVGMLHAAVVEADESSLSVRTKFMIETVNNLKNNRAKAGATASAVVGEHITRMKKSIGTLSARKATEPLRLSLADLRNAGKTGKWWLVGASWKGEEHAAAEGAKTSDPDTIDDDLEDIEGDTDLLSLAKEMGMNTEIRRAIFISIMSASDVKDAQLRLLKLRLKKTQELEIPRVLIKCVSVEQTYNQYYTLIAQRLCNQNRRSQKAFQFGLWELFRRMGENYDASDDTDDGQDEEQTITTRQVVNLGQMFGKLMEKGMVSVSALKILSFGAIRAKTTAFLEVVFTSIFQNVMTQSSVERQKGTIAKIFEEAAQAPSMIPGLQAFLEQLAKADALLSGKDAKLMKQCCLTAVDELRRLENENTDGSS